MTTYRENQDYVTDIGDGASIRENVTIGKDVMVGRNVTIECREPRPIFEEGDTLMTKHLRLNFTTRCNLGCSYCVSHKYKPNKKPSIIDEKGLMWYINRIQTLLSSTDTSDLVIDLMGEGDVLQDPHFESICAWALLRGYDVEIQTNLHGWTRLQRVLNQFTKAQAKKVTVNTSYHLGHYLDSKTPTKSRHQWLAWFKKMYDSGVTIGKVDIPLTPNILEDPHFEADLTLITLMKGKLNPNILVGPYQGKEYPQDYTSGECWKVTNILHQYNDFGINWITHEIATVPRTLHLKDLPCNIRTNRIDIMADGRIQLCPAVPRWNAGITLFDSLENANRLFEEHPILCPNDVCGCLAVGIKHCLEPNGIPIRDYLN